MVVFRPAQNTPEDIAFILHAHREIEGTDARLTHDRLVHEILLKNPKAFIDILEEGVKPVGMILYAQNYWASVGPVLWISQMYVLPDYRGRYVFKLKAWVEKKAKEWQASVIAWGTHRAAGRSSRLWESVGAKDISDGYSFWIKKL